MYNQDYSEDYDPDGDYWTQRPMGGPGGGAWPRARPVPLHRQPMHMPYGGGVRRPMMMGDEFHPTLLQPGPGVAFRPPIVPPPLPHNPLSGQLTPSPHVANAASSGPRGPAPGSREGSTGQLYRDFATSAPLQIKIEYSTGAISCDVTWRPPLELTKSMIDFSYRIDAHGGHTQTMELPSWKTRLTMKTTPGQWYTVEVSAISKGKMVAHGSVQIKAVFTREEMQKMYNVAVDFVKGPGNMHPFEVFYRCKPKPYWDDIYHHRNGIMEVYLKDDNGQAASPVNGVLKGLFFSGRLLSNGILPPNSPFGNVRMCVPAQMLYNPIEYTAYFSDFYCNYITHYVTIIVCRRGTSTENFCRQTLIPIEMDNNPFLVCMPSRSAVGPGQQRLYEYHINRKVWVETYYTDNVPLMWGRFDNIDAWGAGTSRVGGLEHNKYCTVCNLYPLKAPGDTAAPENADFENVDEQVLISKVVKWRGKWDYNTTLHLCVQIERDRLAADGDLYTGCGDSDVIETLCSMVDHIVGQVGDTLEIPDHGNVGQPYVPLYARILKGENGHEVKGGGPAPLSNGNASGTSGAKTLEPADVYFSPAARAKLNTELAKVAFDKLAHTARSLAVRWKDLSALLDSLNQSVALLDKKVVPLKLQMAK